MALISTLLEFITLRRYKRLRKALVFVLAVLLSTGAIMEVLLRYFHTLLPLPVSSFIATSYHSGFGGIYYYSPQLHMRLMKPNFSRQMYYNGYRWHHQTDQRGFRNPAPRDHADVVLLGDSMIYGHGVDEQGTVRHHLEKLLNKPVANLGIQGGSAHQEYQLLKNYALELSPKLIVLFFLTNDIRDLWAVLTEDQMRRFLSRRDGDGAWNVRYFDSSPQPSWQRTVPRFVGLHVARATYAVFRLIGRILIPDAAAAKINWRSRPLFQKNPKLLLAMEFHLLAVKRMQTIAGTRGISFVNVFIHTGQAHYAEEEPVYEEILQDFSEQEGIPFISLRGAFSASALHRDALFLKNDGHFTSSGAKLAAETLAGFLGRMKSHPE